MIRVENLSKEFKSNKKYPGFKGAIKSFFSTEYITKKAVDDISFEINDGEIVGYIGANGAGKTTLLRLLTGLYEPDEGKISVSGKHAMLLENDYLYEDKTGLENLKIFGLYFGYYVKDYKKYSDSLNITEHLLKRVSTYSKGMKRQAMLALALAIAPKYLLLDEAFDGLDPVMRLAFKKAINQMIDENMTVIISSHNLRELEDICDSFGILDNGCMTTSGDLYDIKDHIHKIQLAFKEELNKEEFSHLDVLSFHKQSRVINMVVKGDINEIKDYLRMFNPIMLEVLPVNLEEIFIYEMERKGYGVYD